MSSSYKFQTQVTVHIAFIKQEIQLCVIITTPLAWPTVLITVGVIIVATILTIVVSLVCFIILSKKKTAGEFVILKSPSTLSMMIFFYLYSIPTTGRGTSQW